MKTLKTSTSVRSILLGSVFLAAAPMLQAVTYYWDRNDTVGGFGAADGTWGEPTVSSWSTSAAGTATPAATLTTLIGDDLRFGTGSLGLATGTITVSGTVDAASLTVNDNSGTITFSGGTINLGAAATINTGGRTINMNSSLSGAGTSLGFSGGGTVIFGAGGSAGAGSVATVSGGTILRFSASGHGALGGSSGFTINLGNATTGGTLAIGNSGTVGNAITVVAGTGTRSLTNSGSPSGMTFSGVITANENLSVSITGGGTLSTTGGVGSTIAASKTVTYTSSNTGNISNSALFGGAGAIAYGATNSGNITVSGAKTYTGGTTLNAMSGTGVVVVSTSSTGPANSPTNGAFGTGTVNFAAATKMRAGTTADITVGNALTFNSNATFTTVAAEKSLIFTGNASLLTSSRTLTVETGSTVAGEYVEFQGDITGGVSIGLTKAGAGELRLSGTNTYGGNTDLSAGSLVVDGSLTGALTSSASTTLSGSGTIGGNASISGAHSPGNSPGIQTFSSNLTYNTGSSVSWELASDAIGTRGTDFDGINVGGTLNFAATTGFNLAFSNPGSTVDWTDTFWDSSYTGTNGWLVYSGATTLSNFSNLNLVAVDWTDSLGNLFSAHLSGNSFSLHQDGQNVYLNYVAVPEPSVAVLGGLGLMAMLRRRRK